MSAAWLVVTALVPVALGRAQKRADAPTAPGEGDGVVLVDGRRLAGAVEEADGVLRVAPRRGKAQEVPLAEAALVESDGEARRTGEEYPVYLAFRTALWSRHVDGLRPAFEAYLRVRLQDQCRRLYEEARAHGASERLLEELLADVERHAQTPADNADLQRERIREQDEDPARAASAARALAAADWCRDHDLPLAASVLVGDALELVPDAPDALERARGLVPEAFPRSDAGTERSWLVWARELLPCSGAFVPAADPLRRRAKGVWKDAFCLRTPNVVLFTRARDPAVVGGVLRSGEGVVRVLTELLPIDDELVAEHPSIGEPLELRLHATRNDYLFESSPRGVYARTGVPGYYWPEGKHARFHVPSDVAPTDALGRGLPQVVVHAVAHQYVGERWLGSGRAGRFGEPDRAGYWLVEGLARWLEDQPLELGLPGRAFDAGGTRSLVVAARAVREDAGLALGTLVAESQERAAELPLRGGLDVELPDGRRATLPPRALFHEQAGALAHFLATGAGPQARAAFVDALRHYCLHEELDATASALGFEDTEALETAFREHLARVAQP